MAHSAWGEVVFLVLLSNLFCCSASLNEAEDCDEANCKLPDCFCSGSAIPGGLKVGDVPQMVLITFDDDVNIVNFEFYKQLFNDGYASKKNPNGCNITGTFFVSHEYTNYRLVEQLRHWRHEIADHSITHRTPTSWWRNASYTEWKNEIEGQKEIIHKFAQIEGNNIKGFRAPFLQVGGNKQFKALWDGGALYDSSMPTPNILTWPYTFDFKSTQSCEVGPCPTDSFPGLWEIPMTEYIDSKGLPCCMVDQCTRPESVSAAYELLTTNFMRHYQSNRSPFPVFMHSAWFSICPGALQAMEMFLNDILRLGDTYVVTLQQAIAWVKNPTPLGEIKEFGPWQCSSPAPPPACMRANVCKYLFKGSFRYFHTCERSCPNNYPWYGNPDGN